MTEAVETFPVTFRLQRGLRANQRLPRFPTQRDCAVPTISNQRVHGISGLVDDNVFSVVSNLHPEARQIFEKGVFQ